jgi:Tfp pilus assembly protein PilN
MNPQVNLLPKFERYSNLSYYLFISGLVLLLVLAGVLTYFFVQEREALRAHEAEIAFMEEEKSLLEARLESEAEPETTMLAEIVAFADSHAVPVSPLVNELEALLPENSYLVRYIYNYHDLQIETHFETMTDTAGYMELLTNARYLSSPRVDYIETMDPDTGGTEEGEALVNFDLIPRYHAEYSMEVNHDELMMEEDEDE